MRVTCEGRWYDVPARLLAATADLWRLTRTKSFYGQPEFQALQDVCKEEYNVEGGNLALGSPLGDVLRACGYLLPPNKRALALPPNEAAQLIHRAFVARTAKRVHLCPLDWADDMPRITFGPNSIGQFAAEELMALADAGRLARSYWNVDVDWSRLAQLHWLIVEETVPITETPTQRSMPFLFLPTKADLGAFNPHQGGFPAAVEDAIFVLLLAPWEEWSESVEVDWRGFRIPWVFTSDGDLFARSSSRPPDADSLTFQPHFFTTADGQEEEVELPASFHLKEGLKGLSEVVNRRSNGTPFWALSASNRDPLGARGFGWRDHQG